MIIGPSAAGGMSDLVAHHHHMSGFAAHHHHHHMGLGGMMAAGMVNNKINSSSFSYISQLFPINNNNLQQKEFENIKSLNVFNFVSFLKKDAGNVFDIVGWYDGPTVQSIATIVQQQQQQQQQQFVFSRWWKYFKFIRFKRKRRRRSTAVVRLHAGAGGLRVRGPPTEWQHRTSGPFPLVIAGLRPAAQERERLESQSRRRLPSRQFQRTLQITRNSSVLAAQSSQIAGRTSIKFLIDRPII
jgi:hypothetical protein